MIIPLKQTTNPAYLFEALQPGEAIPLAYGGLGVSSLNQLQSTYGFASALSALSDVEIASPTLNNVLTWDGTKWSHADPPGATGGEANSGSNLGGGTASSFINKVGVDLRFRTLSGVNVVVTNVGNVIQVSAQTSSAITNSNQIDHGSVLGLSNDDHPQYVLSSTNNNLSSTVSNHIANTANPHAVTAAQVGNTTAQWNASAIGGSVVSSTLAPSANQTLIYNGSVWTASTVALGGGSGEVNTASNLGAGPGSSFSGKVGVDLQFRTLSGVNVVITNVGNIIQVSAQTSTALTNSIQVDHGSVSGLGDDDHPQYVLSSTNNNLSSTVSNHIASASVHFTQAQIDHGAILNLSLNHHPQYVLSATNNTLSSTVTSHIGNTSNPHNTTAAQVGNTTPQWNASSLSGIPLNITSPLPDNAALFYIGGQFSLSSVITSVNGELGDINITGASGITFTNTATSNFVIGANYTSSIWNASSLAGTPLSGTLAPTTNQALVYNGSVWTASSIPTGGHGGPGGPGGGITIDEARIQALRVSLFRGI
jgi:hypothetical protein